MTPTPPPRPLVWMILGALLFAVMAALTNALGDRCDWLLIALVRAAVMFGLAVSVARAQGIPLAFREPRTLWLRSLAGSVSLVCNFYAMTKLPVAEVLTLLNMYPLWILLLSNGLARRLPGVAEALGVACGIVGVILIERPDVGGVRLASGVAVLGSISTAVAMLGLHRLRGVDARAIVAHFAGVAGVVALLWMIVRGGPTAQMMPDAWGWVMLLGVALSGTIGQFCLTKAYASGAPTQVSLVGLSQVAFGLGFDMVIWGRAITPTAGVGLILILAPSAWLASRGTRRTASPPPRPEPETTVEVARVTLAPPAVACRGES